jgi:hypothetical protein
MFNALSNLTFADVVELWQHGVFYASILTIILAALHRWAVKWVHPSFARSLEAIIDLISELGALNLKDRIKPVRVWDGEDRRGGEKEEKKNGI